jgi:hypothetical protein
MARHRGWCRGQPVAGFDAGRRRVRRHVGVGRRWIAPGGARNARTPGPPVSSRYQTIREQGDDTRRICGAVKQRGHLELCQSRDGVRR